MYRFRCLYLRDIWGYRDWVGFCVEGLYFLEFCATRDADIKIGRVRAWKALARHIDGCSLYCPSLGWCA